MLLLGADVGGMSAGVEGAGVGVALEGLTRGDGSRVLGSVLG